MNQGMTKHQEITEHATEITRTVAKYMFGMEGVIHLCLVALYSGGHVLLEANPGMGKTALVNILAYALKAAAGRIQFTPDLMPSDIIGSYGPNPESPRGQWEFNEGPIFAQFLLADEINRATPKTQSAMLQAMQERFVTVQKSKKDLPKPFMVLATQNPIDQEGTFNLPEAQADRFMFKIMVPTPDAKTINLVLGKDTGLITADFLSDQERDEIDKAHKNNQELKEEQKSGEQKSDPNLAQTIEEFGADIQASPLVSGVCKHIDNIYLATNGRLGDLYEVNPDSKGQLEKLIPLLKYGLGPRGATALALGAKTWALLPPLSTANSSSSDSGREPAWSQYQALARVAIPALRHRIKVDFDWRDKFEKFWNSSGRKPPVGEQILDHVLLDRYIVELVLLTMPNDPDYRRLVKSDLLDTVSRELF